MQVALPIALMMLLPAAPVRFEIATLTPGGERAWSFRAMPWKAATLVREAMIGQPPLL